MGPALEKILKELRRRLEALYGSRLVRLSLYGSQRRLGYVKKIVILIITFLFVISVNVQSQNPTPSPSEKSKPQQQQQINKDQQQTQSDKRGSEQSPLVVKTINSPKTQAEADQERKDRAQKTSYDCWFLVFTALLAFGAFLQICVLIWHGYFFKGTLDITRKAAVAGEIQANALMSADRAHLFVKVKLNPSKEESIDIITYGPKQATETIPIEITVTNHGKTPAILIDIWRVAGVYDDIDVDKLINSTHGNDQLNIITGTELINTGENATYNDYLFLDNDKMQLLEKPGYRIVCFGCFKYEDIFGISHFTAYCWQWQELIENFYPDERDRERNKRT